jgi:hypothetical protein
MKVIVDGMAGIVTAEETDDLNALSVQLRSTDEELAVKVLGDYGRLAGSHVWLDIESLKSFAPMPRSCSWDERFAKTMAYARSKGWVDETGKFVRAHIEGGEA